MTKNGRLTMMRFAPISLILVTLATGLLVAACGDSTSCSIDADCFKGEYCSNGTCVAGSRPVNAANAANNANASNSANASNAANNANASNSANASNGANGVNNVGDYACLVDPFDPPACEVNEDTFPVTFHPRTVGCQNAGWEALDETRTETLCLRDVRDRYSQLYIDCEDASFVIEITLTPRTECDPSLYRFDAFFGGLSCEDDAAEETIRCETLDDGSQRIQILIPPVTRGSVLSGTIVVEPVEADTIQLEYDLRVQFKQ